MWGEALRRLQGFPANYHPNKERAVPRIYDDFLNCSFYVYKSKSDATAGERTGGSGFWTYVRFQKNPDTVQTYAVTNSHVIHRAGRTTSVLLVQRPSLLILR